MEVLFRVGTIIYQNACKGKEEHMTSNELLIAWLNDAHGMENALIKRLE
jgi:hypothetical protein